MRYEDFSKKSPGRLVPTVHGAKAFVPNALPPEIRLGEIALGLADAVGGLGELKGACRRLANPFIFIRPLQRLEAQTSSAMEGTHTTADKLVLAEAGVSDKSDTQTAEVSNYIKALQEAIADIKENPITHRTFKKAHKTLLSHVGSERGQEKLPGEFKRDQNMIGSRSIENARFIPPPPNHALDCISDLEKFINSDRPAGLALLDIALVHYQFETIHPFADGNGRVGRMLITLMAIQRGILDVPALFLSPALEGTKDEYIDRLYRVSAFGEWHEWLNFFFGATAKTARNAVKKIDEIISLQEIYRQKAAGSSRSSNLLNVVDMLFESPVIRPRDIQDRLGITDAAARRLLGNLVEIGVLVEYTGMYPRIWLAAELVRLSTPE